MEGRGTRRPSRHRGLSAACRGGLAALRYEDMDFGRMLSACGRRERNGTLRDPLRRLLVDDAGPIAAPSR